MTSKSQSRLKFLGDLQPPPDLLPHYRAYMREISQFIADLDLPWDEPRDWWTDCAECRVLVALDPADRPAGFCILGWGSLVDEDVEGEILEFYIAPSWRRRGLGLSLAREALRHLPTGAGLQCYAANHPGRVFWRQILTRAGISFTETAATDGNIPVCCFRFSPETG